MESTIHQVVVDYESDVVPIYWHVWWPSPNDPFYLFNPGPVEQRVAYYDITFVPDVVVDGEGAGAGGPLPSSYVQLAAAINQRRSIPSPLAITCSGFAYGDSCHATTDVTTETPQGPGDFRLFVALVEDTMTTGGSTLDAVDAVDAEGGKVARVLCLVDRGEGAVDAFAQRGLTLEPLFTRADLPV